MEMLDLEHPTSEHVAKHLQTDTKLLGELESQRNPSRNKNSTPSFHPPDQRRTMDNFSEHESDEGGPHETWRGTQNPS